MEMKELLIIIDRLKFFSINGSKVELIVAPLFKDGKYDDTKRVITVGLQGSLSSVRNSFIVDAKDFDSKTLPYLISYYEGSETLTLDSIVRSTLEDVTSKAIYETETGNLLYLESLTNASFDVVNSKKSDIDRTIIKPVKTQEEKDWEEILQYGRLKKERLNIFEKNFTEEEIIEVNKMIEVLSNEDKVNFGNSRRSKENNQRIIEDFLKHSSFNTELKNKINENIWKISTFLGSEKRIKVKLDLTNPLNKEKLDFATNDLVEANYYELRYMKNISEESRQFGKNKEAELNRIKEKLGKDSKGNICDNLLGFLEKSVENNNIKRSINEALGTNIESYEDYIKDDYNELNDAIDLVIGGKLDSENFEFVVKHDFDNVIVRIALLNGLSRMDSFEFIFTNKEEFENRLKPIIDKLLKVPDTKIINTSEEATQKNNKILLEGYAKDYFVQQPKVKKNIIKEINPTSFAKLHEYVNNYKIRNDNNILEVFERDSLLPYTPLSEREKIDIEFATYWNVMAGIFESAYDTMLGEKYAFNNINEYLFNIMNEYFITATVNEEEIDLMELKRLFAESKVPHALVIFNRLFKNQYYLDYVKKYYSSIVEEKEYEIEEYENDFDDLGLGNSPEIDNDLGIDLSILKNLEKEILDVAREKDLDQEKDKLRELGEEQAQDLMMRSGAEDQAEKLLLMAGAEETAKDIVTKSGAEDQARRLIDDAKTREVIIKGAEEEAIIRYSADLLRKLEKEILDKAKEDYELYIKGAEDQAMELALENDKKELIAQIRNVLTEIIKIKQEKEDTVKEKEDPNSYINANYDEFKEMVFAIDDFNNYSDKNSPGTVKIFFTSPETAEVIISLGLNENEEVLFQQDFSKDQIVELTDYLVNSYLNNGNIKLTKSFNVPNKKTEGFVVLVDNENIFQMTEAPSDVVEAYKKKFTEKGMQEELESTKEIKIYRK